MKLSSSQIEKLYNFTEKHYVEWYDVQTELVDHLANGIESQWKTNPNLSFKDALNFEFKKFGIMGFSDVIEEKTKALNRHYLKLVWNFFKDFFKLPKIILTLLLIWGYYQFLVTLPNKLWIVLPTAILLLFVPIWEIYKQSKKIKKQKKLTNKKWLFDSVSIQFGGIVHFINIAIQILFFYINTDWSNAIKIFFSIGIVSFSMMLYVAIFVVSPKLISDMAKQYSDYKFV